MHLRHYPFLVLVLCVSTNFLFGFKHVWSVLVPSIESEFNVSRSLAVLPFSVMSITNIVGFLGIDYIKSKIGLRLTLLVITLSSGLGLMLASLSHDIMSLTLSYAGIYGLGHALGYVLAVTLSVKWFYNSRRGLAAGLTSGGYSLGTLVLAPLTSFLVNSYGWRIPLMLLGVVSLAVMLVATLILNEPVEYEDNSSKSFSPLDLLKSSVFYAAWLMLFFTSLIDGFAISHLTPFMVQYVGVPSLIASVAISIYSAINFLSRILMGGLSERLGIPKILLMVYLLSTLNVVLFPYYRTVVLAYLGSSVVGLVHGTNVAFTPLIAASMWGSKYLGSNYGLLLTAATVAMFVGPIIGGLSYDLTGNYDVGLHLLSALSALGIPLLLFLWKKFE
ncbi:MAG: MFS transporter [Sulfolobales archaeon]|nr:MFS transporter [Sulfolobales archaeon]MCX8186146.1 MFS transporter [Sulfolobales archaeon]